MHGICNFRLVYKTNHTNPHPPTVKAPPPEKINKIMLPFYTSKVSNLKFSKSKLIGKQVFQSRTSSVRVLKKNHKISCHLCFWTLILQNKKWEFATHAYRTRGFYNHFYNTLRLVNVIPNFPFITSETTRSYYLWTSCVRVASRVVKLLKVGS